MIGLSIQFISKPKALQGTLIPCYFGYKIQHNSEDDYFRFYKSLTNDNNGYLVVSHYEDKHTEFSFTACIFVPKQNIQQKIIKLYIRHEFYADLLEIVPEYLQFLVIIIDVQDASKTIPKERFVKSKCFKVMKNRLTKKSIELLNQISKNGTDLEIFYKNISLGIYEDSQNKNELVKLLRFKTNQNVRISLENYVSRMKPYQTKIYWTCEEEENSPMMEYFDSKGIEVIFAKGNYETLSLNCTHRFNNYQLIGVVGDLWETEDDEYEKNVKCDEISLKRNNWRQLWRCYCFKTSCEDKVYNN